MNATGPEAKKKKITTSLDSVSNQNELAMAIQAQTAAMQQAIRTQAETVILNQTTAIQTQTEAILVQNEILGRRWTSGHLLCSW